MLFENDDMEMINTIHLTQLFQFITIVEPLFLIFPIL